ncbi:MAG: YfhO family protein [Clostridia bacterium]|nr:YfhO family protein [Clostridia bacterium]
MTYKNDKKNVLFFIICLSVLGAGLIIEPINKMWHTGSYYSFPYRYSFLMVLLLIMGSLYYINKNIEGAILEEGESSKKPKWDAYVFVGFYAIIVSLLSLELSKTHPAGELSIAQFSLYLMIFILSCLTIHFALREKWKKLQLGKLTGGVLLVIFTIMQALSLNIAFMGHESINEERVTDIFNVEVSTLDKNYKIKDREFVYNHNFPYILDHASMSTWIHISSEEQWVGYNKLGYQSVSTILSSSGGTLITDVLMGNKYILSRYELDSDYYTKLDTFDFKYIDIRDSSDVRDEEMNLYELNLDFDVTYTTNVDLSTLLENSDDWFYNHNLLYKSLYNQSADIITPTTYTTEDLGEGKYKLIVSAPADKIIYMSSKYNDTYHLTMDGKESLLSNGLVDLGISSTGTIELEISIDNNDGSVLEDSISFGAFDVETFKTIHNAKAENDSTLTFEGEKVKVNIDNTNDDKYLFIPYINLKNMVGQVNGKDVTVQSAFDTFIFVELEEGLNEVVVKYEPQYIKLCLIVTIAAAVVFVIFTILNKYFHLSDKKPIIWIGFVGGCVILLIVGFLVYLKPLFNFFVILLS